MAVLIAIYAAANYKSCYAQEETIARFLEKEMPIGSSFEEVANWLEKRKGLETKVLEHGGEKTIKARVGECSVVFNQIVTGFWSFDENGRLLKVEVKKDVDAL